MKNFLLTFAITTVALFLCDGLYTIFTLPPRHQQHIPNVVQDDAFMTNGRPALWWKVYHITLMQSGSSSATESANAAVLTCYGTNY